MIEYFLNNSVIATGENFHLRGQLINGIGFISNQNPLDSDISFNGQLLLETTPSIQTIGQQDIIDNSGQFFLSGGFLKTDTGFLDLQSSNSNLIYDIKISGYRFYFSSSDHTNLITGFSGTAGNLSGQRVFLNGVKLVSGIHYSEDLNGNFNWIDPDSDITGLLFTSPPINDYYLSGSYDIVGSQYNEDCTIGYLLSLIHI